MTDTRWYRLYVNYMECSAIISVHVQQTKYKPLEVLYFLKCFEQNWASAVHLISNSNTFNKREKRPQELSLNHEKLATV